WQLSGYERKTTLQTPGASRSNERRGIGLAVMGVSAPAYEGPPAARRPQARTRRVFECARQPKGEVMRDTQIGFRRWIVTIAAAATTVVSLGCDGSTPTTPTTPGVTVTSVSLTKSHLLAGETGTIAITLAVSATNDVVIGLSSSNSTVVSLANSI